MTQPTPAQQAEPLEQAKKALRDVVWDGDPTMEQYNALVDAVIAAALRAAVSPQAQIDEAMAILQPNMPESGLVDACKQLRQAYISERDNAEKAEAELHRIDELIARRPALDEPTRYDNIAKAIRCAGQADAATRRFDEMFDEMKRRAERAEGEVERLKEAVLTKDRAHEMSVEREFQLQAELAQLRAAVSGEGATPPTPREEDICVSPSGGPDYTPEHFSGGVTQCRVRGGVLIFAFAGGGEIHVSNPVVFVSPERH